MLAKADQYNQVPDCYASGPLGGGVSVDSSVSFGAGLGHQFTETMAEASLSQPAPAPRSC